MLTKSYIDMKIDTLNNFLNVFILFPFCFQRYSFIDLAQIVCKVPERLLVEQISSSSSDEEYEGYISEPSNLVRTKFIRQKFLGIKMLKFLLIKKCRNFFQNREQPMHVDRTGGSLSLSENDFDSDELDLSLTLKNPRPRKLKTHAKHSSVQSIPKSPTFN